MWGIWDQNIGLNQLLESSEMFCFAAKWHGRPKVYFLSSHQHGKDRMVAEAHRLMDEADIIVHYNGKRFDVPHLNREFLLAGLKPPSPYQQIDLLHAVRRQFKFPSNKLAYVSKALGLEGKVKHDGHELWVRCMAGNREAWKTMREYNVQDVELLEDVYNALQAWIPTHPNIALFQGKDHACPACGSEDLMRRGTYRTRAQAYQQYCCKACGRYSRSAKRTTTTALREASA